MRQTDGTELNNQDERLNDTERGKKKKDGEKGWMGGGRSPQSSHVVFEAGSWLDNRSSFIPQTQ